ENVKFKETRPKTNVQDNDAEDKRECDLKSDTNHEMKNAQVRVNQLKKTLDELKDILDTGRSELLDTDGAKKKKKKKEKIT
uniref:hypothetical protein n=1 Tax=Acinetobacter baumannii TaxID=470 RepID=UPI00148F2464